MTDLDYIVVGGGASGCVVANRLSEKLQHKVLLIEAGKDFVPGEEPKHIRDTFYTAAYVKENLWPDTWVHWLSQRPDEAAQKPTFYEQGNVMGGGSSVNAMVALRGMSLDFNDWVKCGADGWSWDDVLPYYRKLETDLDFDSPEHGQDGPIPVRRHQRDQWPSFVESVTRVLASNGYQYIDDVNGGERNGFGRVPMTNTSQHRVSTAMGYLTPEVRRRQNLIVQSEALVTRLLFEERRCVGVVVKKAGREEVFRAGMVVVCAGSYRTPALLMRSGIGPPDHLGDHGIKPICALPGVGANLHDHPTFAAAAHLKLPSTQPADLRPHANAGLFYSSHVDNCPPYDMYMPIANKVGWHALGERIGALFMVIMKPFSRGCVRLLSSDPNVAPLIEVNAFDDERDRVRAVQSMRFAAEILEAPEVKRHTTHRFGASFTERVSALNKVSKLNGIKSELGAWLLDGPPVLRQWLLRNVVCPNAELEALVSDDAQLESWLRSNVTGFFHPVGTCRIGSASDPSAVVDTVGRVHGLAGIRVADASVMPVIVRATTNLTAIMIGEKMSAHLLDDQD